MRTGSSKPHVRSLATVALILGLAGCTSMDGGPPHGHGAPPAHGHGGPDTRRQIALTPAERDAVLAEMRMMLGSVNGVLHGLSANDPQAIEKAARASGTAVAVDPTLKGKLPQQFLELGMTTHRKFDQLADAARSPAPSDTVIRSLADVTTNCVTCHAMYRF